MVDEGDGASEAAPEREPGFLRPSVLMIAAGVLIVLFAAGFIFQTLRASDLSSEQDEERDAGKAAGEFATAVYGYDHREMEESLEDILDLVTDDYAQEFEQAWTNELQPVIDELRARGEVAINDVYVTEIEGNRSKAVVSFNAVIRSTAGTRRLTGSYLEVSLQKQDGQWLVDDYKLLATTDETLDTGAGAGGSGGGGGGTTPTTTTAPTATTAPG